MVTRKLFFIVSSLLFTSHVWANVTASVNRTEIYDDESLVLTVSVSPQGELNSRDISALESLFIIEQRGQQQSTQIFNGKRSSQVDYQFRLRPKQTGTLAIPNFRVGADASKPIFVNVLDSRQRQDNLSEDAVILSVQLSKADPYVDEAITLTIELAYKIQFRNGTIAEIDLPDFDATVLDEQQTTTTRNGQSYNLYRRIVQLTPLKAGVFSLPALTFSAEYPNQALGRYQRFSRSVQPQLLEVRAIPDEFPAGAFWLPAEQIQLSDNLATQIELQANEHLDWQLTMQVEGLNEKRLPDPVSQVENLLDRQIRLYRNPPDFESGLRKDSGALTVAEPGNYQLPEIAVPWWDTTNDRLQWATLPARTIKVMANPLAVNAQPGTTPFTVSDNMIATGTVQRSSAWWPWLTLAITMVWLVTIALYVRLQMEVRILRPKLEAAGRETSQSNLALTKLLDAEQMSPFYAAVLRQLKEQCVTRAALTPSARAALEALEASLYRSDAVLVERSALFALAKEIDTLQHGSATKLATSEPLSLYPN